MVESTRPSPLPAIDRAMDSRVFTPGFSHAGRRPDGDFPEARWSALCQATELPEQAVTHRLYFSLKAAVNRLSATQSFVYPSAWKDAGCHPNDELRSSWKSMRARRLAAGSAFNCRFSVQETNYGSNRVFGRDRDAHVDVVRHQIPLHDLAFLLFRQGVKNRAKLSADIPEDDFPPSFGHEYNMVLAVPLGVG